jgi:hypothetical protein
MSAKVTLSSPVVTTQVVPAQSLTELKLKISTVLTTLHSAHDTTPDEKKWSIDDPITPEHKAKMVDFFKQNQPVQKTETSPDLALFL